MLREISQEKKDKYQKMISLTCGALRSKQKLKEQNNNGLTEPKNGLTVTKGKGTGECGWGGRRGMRGIGISTCNAGGARGGRYNTETTCSDSTASPYADGQ